MSFDVRLALALDPKDPAFTAFHGDDRVWDVRVLYANHYLVIRRCDDRANVPASEISFF
jgi:hypothetical protein